LVTISLYQAKKNNKSRFYVQRYFLAYTQILPKFQNIFAGFLQIFLRSVFSNKISDYRTMPKIRDFVVKK